jgi:DNA invertase Pin-like site-specific DNA recombinase
MIHPCPQCPPANGPEPIRYIARQAGGISLLTESPESYIFADTLPIRFSGIDRRIIVRTVLYVRCSSRGQDTQAQLATLQEWAGKAGHVIVRVYEDKALSGKRGRDRRPQFDAMLKSAVRREFELIATYSVCRLARSLAHLLEVLQTVKATDCGLYVHTAAVDTTTPAGRALFQMLGIFAEFETELRRERCLDGIAYAKQQGTRSGRPFGRPPLPSATLDKLRNALLAGQSVREAAQLVKVSKSAAGDVRAELVRDGMLTARAA